MSGREAAADDSYTSPCVEWDAALAKPGYVNAARIYQCFHVARSAAVEGELCMESSPSQGLENFVHSPHATMLSGVVAMKTEQIQEALRSNGGIQALLPLFSQFQASEFSVVDSSPSKTAKESPLISTLIGIICTLVSQHEVVQRQMQNVEGFLLLAFLLEQASPQQLGFSVVNVFMDTAHALAKSGKSLCLDLLGKLLGDVLLNSNVWCRVEPSVQLLLTSRVITFLFSDANAVDVRQAIGIRALVRLVLTHAKAQDSLSTLAGGMNAAGLHVSNERDSSSRYEYSENLFHITTEEVLEKVIVVLCKAFVVGRTPPTQAEMNEILKQCACILSELSVNGLPYLDFVEFVVRAHPTSTLSFDETLRTKHTLTIMVQMLNPNQPDEIQSRLIGVIGEFIKVASDHNLLTDSLLRFICDQMHIALSHRVTALHAGSLVRMMVKDATAGANATIDRAGTVMVLELLVEECSRGFEESFVFAELVLSTLRQLISSVSNCHAIAAIHKKIMYCLGAVYQAAVISQAQSEIIQNFDVEQQRKLAAAHADSDTIDLSEMCICAVLDYALYHVDDGWQWFCEFDVILRDLFRQKSLAGSPEYAFVALLFSKAVLGIVCKKVNGWTQLARPFLTVLSAKENTLFLNNMCRLLTVILPQLIEAGHFFSKLEDYFDGDERNSAQRSQSPYEREMWSPESPLRQHAGTHLEDSKHSNRSDHADRPQHEISQTSVPPLLASLNEEVIQILKLLLSVTKFTETIDAETKAALGDEGFWDMCICLICSNIAMRDVSGKDDFDIATGRKSSDSVASETEVRVLELCLAKVTAPNPLGLFVFALVAIKVVDAYKVALEKHVTSLDDVLGVAVPFLQCISSGAWAPYLDATVTVGEAALIKSNQAFWRTGSSVTALVMLIANSDWEAALHVHGKGAIANLIQKESGRQKLRLQRLHHIADDIRRELGGSLSMASSIDSSVDTIDFDFVTDDDAAARDRQRITAISIWRRVLTTLTNDRGVWAPDAALDRRSSQGGSNINSFWRLDDTEDTSRQRMRCVRNPLGSRRLEAVVLKEESDESRDHLNEGQRATDDVTWLLQVQQSLGFKLPVNIVMDSSGIADDEINQLDVPFDESLNLSRAGGMDTSALALEAGEALAEQRLMFSTMCTVVKPGHRVLGNLTILEREFFFSVDVTIEKYSRAAPAVKAYFDSLSGNWAAADVAGVLPRRYLLQTTALEIFLRDRTSIFLVFTSAGEAKMALSMIPTHGNCPNFFFGLPSLFTRQSRRLRKEVLLKGGTAKWVAGDMSNFEYLMLLNTVAGRTYSDLSQYPIFPWILSNYTSEVLDLEDPSNFRDLSKPVGALNQGRLDEFRERWHDWDEEEMGIPRCMYGTHYSTPAYVLFWLLRVEPFTGIALDLQGGTFDVADRLFHSIEQAWHNCLHTSSDVKELIPELFYLPEMFRNENCFELGELQHSGTKVDDVELPPWALSAEDFVQKHRAALESTYVSQNLHHWIDLIFGYKQRGAPAEEADNVFYYLCYEGGVDFDALPDPALREALQSQIHNFGQIPQQLFKRAHPQRTLARTPRLSTMSVSDGSERGSPAQHSPLPRSASGTLRRRALSMGSYLRRDSKGALSPIASPSSGGQLAGELVMVTPESPVTFVAILGDLIVTASCNQCLWVHRLVGSRIEPHPQVKSAAEASRHQLGEPFDQKTTITSGCFAIVPHAKVVLACGFWDTSLQSYTFEGKRTGSMYGHARVLTCVAVSPTGNIIATGSRDATVSVWHYERTPFQVNQSPLASLVGHENAVACVAVDAGLDTVVSGSADACLLHKLNGDLVRVISHPHARRPYMVRFAGTTGRIVVYYRDKSRPTLALFTLNGHMLRDIPLEEQLMDLAISPGGDRVATGGFGRQLKIWSTATLEQLAAQGVGAASIRSVAFSQDGTSAVVGLASGHVTVRQL